MENVNDVSVHDVVVNNFEALLEEEDVPDYVNVNEISHIKVEFDDSKETQEPNEIYQCNICTNKYKKMEILELHMYTHSKQFICPVCFVAVSPKKDFIKHINQHIRDKIKEEKSLLICSFCEKGFNTQRRLNIHLRVHTNERPHRCDICGDGFKQPGTLKVHQVTHTKEKPYICEICKGGFTTSSSLKRHKRKLHDKGKTLNCKHCEARFFNMTDFRNHKRERHPTKVYNKCCRYCFAILNSRFSFRKHQEFHREDKLFNSAGYVCMLCGKNSNGWGKFLAHRRMHMKYSYQEFRERKQNKSLQCKVCSKSFTNTNSLFKHMDVHMKDKIKCDLCPNYFSYFRLKVHVRTMHQKLKCQVCNMVINGKGNVSNHYQKYHPSIEKKYPCKVCGKLYKFKAMLNIHFKLMHEGNAIKNFKCAICGRRFPTKLAMASHLAMTHDKKSKYMCRLCDAVFDTLKEFILHKSTHGRKQSTVKLKSRSLKPKKPRKRFQCEVCKKIFHSNGNYKLHVTHKTCIDFLKRTRKTKKCEVCDKILSTSGLARHLTIHSNFDNACRYCNKKFKIMDSLRRHIRSHHPGENIYKCQSCGEGFDKFFEFIRHQSQQVCYKKLASNRGLARHMAIHSNFDKACKYCDKQFKLMNSLRKHLKIHHPGKKVYECQECGKGFDKYLEWIRHQSQHCQHLLKTENLEENADRFMEIKVEPEILMKEELLKEEEQFD